MWSDGFGRLRPGTVAAGRKTAAATGGRLRPGTAAAGRTTKTATTTINHGDNDNDGDGCDSDGYGPGEGYYPDGGYGYAEGLADVDAWEHAAELSHS